MYIEIKTAVNLTANAKKEALLERKNYGTDSVVHKRGLRDLLL